jgi:hypothetical protein
VNGSVRTAIPLIATNLLIIISSFVIVNQQQPVYAAPLTSQSAIPSNNLVTTTATYEILFTTATTGVVKTVEITFPVGYNVAGTKLLEREGIASGTTAVKGNTVVFTIGSPGSIAAGIPIRLELSNIVNQILAPTSSVTITTKGINGAIIDGPTSAAVPLKQIATTDIANSAVTNLKLGANAVTSEKITDGNVGTNDFANNAVTSQKIGDRQVGNVDIVDNAFVPRTISRNASIQVMPQSFGVVSAFCNSGEQVISGSYVLDGVGEGMLQVYYQDKSPPAGNAWIVAAYNPGSEFSSGRTLTSIAQCMPAIP